MDIVKKLFPESYKLKEVNGFLQTTIVDAELDPMLVTENFGSVIIDTENYTYIDLTEDNLEYLLNLIKQCKQ